MSFVSYLFYHFGLRVAGSFAVLGVSATFLRYFLAALPIIPYTSIWVLRLKLEREFYHSTALVETFIVAGFVCLWMLEKKDAISWILFGTALLSVPALFASAGHVGLSIVVTFLVLGGAGVYHFFRTRMDDLLRVDIVDVTVMLWVAGGLLIKLWGALVTGESYLLQRGGGILGSNHVGGILILLVPLVKRGWLRVVTIAFLLIHFSLGIYLGLVLLGVTSLIARRPKHVGRWAAAVGAFVLVFLLVAPSVTLYSDGRNVALDDFIAHRLRLDRGVSVEAFTETVTRDERFMLNEISIDLAHRGRFAGLGLGGYAWGLKEVGYPVQYSNGHNMYLTWLVEGGLAFAIAMTALVVGSIVGAWKYARNTFAGLFAWAFYGLYSGEIYEVGGLVTAGDYYTFLFVVAYVGWQRDGVHAWSASSAPVATPA